MIEFMNLTIVSDAEQTTDSQGMLVVDLSYQFITSTWEGPTMQVNYLLT